MIKADVCFKVVLDEVDLSCVIHEEFEHRGIYEANTSGTVSGVNTFCQRFTRLTHINP